MGGVNPQELGETGRTLAKDFPKNGEKGSSSVDRSEVKKMALGGKKRGGGSGSRKWAYCR